jgi:transmembrane sensor
MELIYYLEIEDLLSKYLNKEITGKERQRLYDLLLMPGAEESFKAVLNSNLEKYDESQQSEETVDFDRLFRKIKSEIKVHETGVEGKFKMKRLSVVRNVVFQGLSVAAVFIFAFFLGSKKLFNSNSEIINGTVEPIELNYTEIKVPLGAISEIILPDSSQVMLNAGSTIRFRSDYNSNNRDIQLQGEGYFKVAKNENLPLIVNTGNLKIKAVGTEFNVKAYPDEGIIETTLVSGIVEISKEGQDNVQFDLKPNQKAIYLNKSDLITIDAIKELEPLAVELTKTKDKDMLVSPIVDVDQVVAWTQSRLIIKGENLSDLCAKLQRKYDVNIVFSNDDIKKYRFSGTLENETLEQVLQAIKLNSPIDYIINGRNVLLLTNKDQESSYEKYLNN